MAATRPTGPNFGNGTGLESRYHMHSNIATSGGLRIVGTHKRTIVAYGVLEIGAMETLSINPTHSQRLAALQ